MNSRALLALLCCAAPLLGGCRYNFVPLIPRPVDFKLPVRIVEASLTREKTELVLKARIDGKFDPGYLTVNWFDNSRPIGQDSVYLDTAQRDVTFRLTAPQQAAYRATLTFGGALLRQVELYEVEP
ncbi:MULTISPECIES: hypothetical protein [Deinococcus]|uniref:Ig-like domain-containing protein n=1 Tax=Deinococcus cavernae TaxID=2320857 RepID=A0A418VBJ7_9DEIO|nr:MULTISPECIES: hypothetical protein [Deinococcus]RJF73477.1 hypothetical protein D3875_19930 [Deinococcus cavernae]